jgi:regulator of protease activity HflC (stomatin/prohibitin superfamily)
MANDFIDALSHSRRPNPAPNPFVWLAVLLIGAVIIGAWSLYNAFLVDVPRGHVAIMIHKTGLDLRNGEVAAPSEEYKGVQREMLTEGRHFRNPFSWQWQVVSQVEIPEGKLGVLIRMYGDELPPGEFIATKPTQKGIVHDVLKSGGRYPINTLLEKVELFDPITIQAGYKGVVTLLSGPLAEDPNQLLVPDECRGVQKTTLEPATYYFNPYIVRVNPVDCRSHRHNLATEEKDFGFPSKDGFWVSLDGIIEYRIQPDKAAEVFVLYNETPAGDQLDVALVRKVILPNARSFCRLEGSNSLSRELMQGTRNVFQDRFQTAMKTACDPMGIEVVQAMITEIRPPDPIAKPIRQREIANLEEQRYKQEIIQQSSESKLAVEKQLVLQKTALVQADQEVIKATTEAMRQQEVSVTKANENKSVAQFKLDAAKDEAAAIMSRGKAAADVVTFKNEAEAAGWKKSVAAFGGNGAQYAQYVLFEKMSSAYRQMMVNTADSPIMRIFESFAPVKEKPGDEKKTDKK